MIAVTRMERGGYVIHPSGRQVGNSESVVVVDNLGSTEEAFRWLEDYARDARLSSIAMTVVIPKRGQK